MGFFSDIKGLDLICEFLIKSSLVLSLSLLLRQLLRKQSASLRHFLLSISLIGLLFLPLFSSLMQGWETRLLPAWQIQQTIPFFSDQHSVAYPHQMAQPNNQISSNITGNLSETRTDHPANQSTVSSLRNTIGYCLIGVWSIGLIFLLLRTFLGLFKAIRLTQQGKSLETPPWKQLLHRFLKLMALKRRVNLLSHERVSVPFTWGVTKPVVIMPDASRDWADDLRSTALSHELSHIKRGDFLVMILARISCILYWFNPLSWWAFKALRKEQEKACDELALKTGIKPSTYAANLLSLKNTGVWKWNPTVAVLGAVGNSQFNDRLVAILKKKLYPKEVKMKTKILLSLIVILAVTFIGMARPSYSAINSDMSTSEEHLPPSEAPVSSQDKKDSEKQEQAQSAKKESEEKKSKEKHIKSIAVDKKTGQIEIITTKDGKTKKIVLDEKPIIILEKEGLVDKLALTSEGKSWTIKKDEKGHVLIEGDKISLIKGDEKAIKLKNGSVIRIKTDEKEDGRKIITVEGPHIVIHKGDKAHEHVTIHVKDQKGEQKKIVVKPNVEVKPAIAIKIKEKILQEQIQKIQEMVQKIVEQRMDRIEALENYEAHISGIADKKVQERLNKIFERLSEELESKVELQAESLKKVEESLEKLSEELKKKEEKLKKIDIYWKEKPAHMTIKHKDGVKKVEGDHIFVHKGEGSIIEVINKDEGYTLIFKSTLSSQQKEAYIKALEKLKSRLPEGYKFESEFDDESNSFYITIKGDDKTEESKEKLKELLNELKEELSKAEDNLSGVSQGVR